jgi:hypothetical protein
MDPPQRGNNRAKTKAMKKTGAAHGKDKFNQLSGRLCRNCSAGFQPAVSQISNLQCVVRDYCAQKFPRLHPEKVHSRF